MDPSGDGGGGLTATGLFCGSCGAQSSQTAKFCGECGTRLTQATPSAEYKQVTVLFADVVHSMDIAATVGAERLREIMAGLVDGAAVEVKRYGGTLDKFTGDGIMAVFGAPVALEDHALRACLAALGVQEEAKRLAIGVHARDGVDLQVRVGLNSGQVIAGEIGSGSFGYTAVGEQVGMAQRMESVAPAGGVMLSESTARLVEHHVVLSEPEMVHIKGSDQPVTGRQLLGIPERDRRAAGAQSTLVGRRWELAAIKALLERAIDGHGAVVTMVGSPGIGKSRLVREVGALASARGIKVFSTFCESHATDVPFRVVARLLRAVLRISGLDDQSARARARAQLPDADLEDMLLLDDLLGIADPNVELPRIDPDARRRRLINTTQLARTQPTMYVIEDAHWIDQVSESMLADFVPVIPQTPSLVLITYRPEYSGALSRVPGAQSIALAPLTEWETATLVAGLLGADPSVRGVGTRIAERAAGNPFFAEEMVRDLAERGVLRGNRSAYESTADAAEVSVPATLQATIAARIDRLDPAAKRTLSAAAVIGSKFSRDLLETLGIDPVLESLVGGEFIDQITFTGNPAYAFHHPLIRTVAYESQLKSDRTELHRRVAAAIEAREPESADGNAALIAEHLEAAGDLHAAYGWHMRAGGWATTRDIAASYLSWDRARRVADALPADDPGRTAMRIAPRALLCGNGFRVHADISGGVFEELRQLCAEAGDKASLAIGMAGLMMERLRYGRVREASRLASGTLALVESIGDPTLTVGLPFMAINTKLQVGEIGEALRWSQTVIDLADGDATKGNFIIGSPLAVALATRGTARCALGRPGWRDDYDRALAMARSADPMSHARVITFTYGFAMAGGVPLADDAALRDIEGALRIIERSSEDIAVGLARFTLGLALVHRDSSAERERGLKVLGQVRDMCHNGRFYVFMLPVIDVWAARGRARCGDRDGALPQMRSATNDLFQSGQHSYGIPATGFLVETLLDRGADNDVAEAEAAIERLAAAPTDEGLAIREILLLRLRALLARAHGDETAYRENRDRYRDMAISLGFEGHVAWAEAMP